MKIFTPLKFAVLLIFLFGLVETSFSQRPRNPRKPKIKNNKKSILNNLPTFFVDDSKMPKYLKKIYKRDAARMSLRLLNQELRVSKQTVIIPEELVQAIYNAMVAIRTSDYASIDTVATKYYVRTFPVPNVEQIVLVTQHDIPWLDPLKRRQDTTGSPSINQLMRDYNLSIRKLVYLDEERVALVMQSPDPINIPALMMRFFMQEGIGAIEEVLPYGDGNDIDIARTKEGWDINYKVKFGNCSHQCQKYHNWNFSVAEDGEVTYVGSSGHTIPPWVGAGGGVMSKQYPDVLAKN